MNYPQGTRRQTTANNRSNKSIVNFANRGMALESEINETNDYYLLTNKAIVHKKPTPIQVVNVHYPKRSAAKITEAYFQEKA
ncbi:MAG TPA: Holliday junction resolvase RecU, partial [Pseudogracilibacillus sp.]|nr:Holliday junction resolvase RecU [Pseudogracilibacillus sp.]